MKTIQHEARLARLYRGIRQRTVELCAPLAVEDQVVQSMADASPTKWHLAHTSWFFETFVLKPGLAGYSPFDARYGFLFNSYYHAAGERHPRPERGMLSRPTLDEVLAYRRYVDHAMERLFERGALDADEQLAFVAELGLNHEEQHQELILTDVKHVLARNPLEPAYRTGCDAAHGGGSLRGPRWTAFDGALIEIGWDAEGFAFDNEGPRHRIWCESFELADRLVTCGEFLEFIEDGGYARSDLWLSDGWDARVRAGWEAPLYWIADGARWRCVTLGGARDVDPAEPVCHVSLYEADAFARWSGARLPLESEWERAAAELAITGNLLESERFHPAPPASNAGGLQQVFGDVWEWTASAYAPYPGFEPFSGTLGEYNGKFMSSRYVLRGGSCVTPARHLRATYRNFFAPDARWQFTGIRLARTLR